MHTFRLAYACRPNDQLHLVHVLPKMQMAAMYGAPPVDFLPQQDPVAYEQLLKNAEHFITDRFLPKLSQLRPDPIVHIVKARPVACLAPWMLC